MLPDELQQRLRTAGVIGCLALCTTARADINGGVFAATGSDVTPRFFHAAGTLPDGTVMVTGGLGLQFSPPSLFSLEAISFYDATSETWLDDGSMLSLHDDFAVAALGTCRILIVDGGVPLFGQEAPSTTCETLEITLPDACRAGDFDNDADVDIDDFDEFAQCMTGPGAAWLAFRCWPTDLHVDGDVDLHDTAVFQLLFAGSWK